MFKAILKFVGLVFIIGSIVWLICGCTTTSQYREHGQKVWDYGEDTTSGFSIGDIFSALGSTEGLLGAGGFGGALLALWQYLSGKKKDKMIGAQIEVIEDLDDKKVKASIREKMEAEGVEVDFHKKVKKATK